MLSLMGGATSSEVLDQNTAEMLYEEAMLKKDGDGNLPAAIKLFQQILTEFPQNRKIAGRAQLQIGLCYEKLGESEALKAYRAVIEKFEDQKDMVRLARERLLMLEGSKSSSFSSEEGLILQALNIPWGTISPDGKQIVYAKGSNEGFGLVLYELATGIKKPLIEFERCKDCWIHDPTWSLDSNQIAFIWHDSNEVWNLCSINSDGTDMRILYSNPEKLIEEISGWMPSGKEIVVLSETREKKHAFSVVKVSDGSLSDILSSDEFITNTSLSQNGQYASYNFRTEIGYDIKIISLATEKISVVVNDTAYDEVLGWTPDNDYLFFSSDRTGEYGVWAQKIEEGKPNGESVLIHPSNGNIQSLGFTEKGSFLFGESTPVGREVYTAELDLETAPTIKNEERVEGKYRGQTSTPLWSPDGAKIAYFFKSNKESNDYNILRIRNLDTDQEREFLLDFKTGLSMQLPRWSPDGTYIYLKGYGNNTWGLFGIDIRTGESRLLYGENNLEAWTSDAKTVFVHKRKSTRKFSEWQSWIIRKDLVSGEEQEIFRSQPGQMLAWLQLSPDENWLEFSMSNYRVKSDVIPRGFYAIPSQGGEIKKLVSTNSKSETIGFFFWAFPNEGFLYTKSFVEKGDRTTSLWHVPSINSAEAINIDMDIAVRKDLSFHSNGKTVAFTSGSSSQSKIWIMENYLPKEKK